MYLCILSHAFIIEASCFQIFIFYKTCKYICTMTIAIVTAVMISYDRKYGILEKSHLFIEIEIILPARG